VEWVPDSRVGEGPVRGRDKVIKFFRDRAEMFDEFTVEPERFDENEGQVLALIRVVGRGSASGAKFDIRITNPFRHDRCILSRHGQHLIGHINADDFALRGGAQLCPTRATFGCDINQRNAACRRMLGKGAAFGKAAVIHRKHRIALA